MTEPKIKAFHSCPGQDFAMYAYSSTAAELKSTLLVHLIYFGLHCLLASHLAVLMSPVSVQRRGIGSVPRNVLQPWFVSPWLRVTDAQTGTL